jgi:3-(3-hydroxy-phenyl)propionate hydroxylase
MRDAFNLAWKLALVVNGKAGEALLDSYQQERRDHAKAMIDLSVTAGNVLAPPKRWHGAVRDGVSWLLNYLPPVKRYFLEMRFKPMPQYRDGALLRKAKAKLAGGQNVYSAEGDAGKRQVTLLDEVIGANSPLSPGAATRMGAERRADSPLARRRRALYPGGAGGADSSRAGQRAGVIRVGDTQNRLKSWFAQHDTAIAVVRPDRFVAAVAIPQTLSKKLDALASKMQLASAQAATTIEQVA